MMKIPLGPWRRFRMTDPWAQLDFVRDHVAHAIDAGAVEDVPDPFHGTWRRISLHGTVFILPSLVGTDFRHEADAEAAARNLLALLVDHADTRQGYQSRMEEDRDLAAALLLAFVPGIDGPVASELTHVDPEDGLPSIRLWNASRAVWRTLDVPIEARIAAARLYGPGMYFERRSGQWILKTHAIDQEAGVPPVDVLTAMRALEGNPRPMAG